MIDTLANYITPARLGHVKRVSEIARKLAIHYNKDSKKVAIAGLLHDVAKDLSPKICQTMQLPTDENLNSLYDEFPSVWHAFAAPKIIKALFNIYDPNILSACQWHCTGKAKLSHFDAIIYIADYIEPERSIKNRDRIETMAYSSLEDAIFYISNNTLSHLLSSHQKVHPHTLACYNHYLPPYRHD